LPFAFLSRRFAVMPVFDLPGLPRAGPAIKLRSAERRLGVQRHKLPAEERDR